MLEEILLCSLSLFPFLWCPDILMIMRTCATEAQATKVGKNIVFLPKNGEKPLELIRYKILTNMGVQH